MKKPHAFGSCSCCGGCTFFADPFDRDDNTDLGADWTEAVGSAEILSSELKLTSSGTRVLAVPTHPSGSFAFAASVRVKITSTSQQPLFIFNWTNSSNYYYARIRFTSGFLGGGSYRLELIQRKAGAETTLATFFNLSFALNQFYTLSVCVDSQKVCSAVVGTQGVSDYLGYESRLPLADHQFGLGVDNAGGALFDDFTLGKHADQKEGCGSCPYPAECSNCPSPVAEKWVVDLGTGGWVNSSCNNCSSIQGEYTVKGASCTYEYREDNICPDTVKQGASGCDLTVPGEPVRSASLSIRLQVFSTTIDVIVRLSVCAIGDDCLDSDGGGSIACGEATSTATYRIARVSSDPCVGVEYTLTKIAESHTQSLKRQEAGATPLCAGTLPETITALGLDIV